MTQQSKQLDSALKHTFLAEIHGTQQTQWHAAALSSHIQMERARLALYDYMTTQNLASLKEACNSIQYASEKGFGDIQAQAKALSPLIEMERARQVISYIKTTPPNCPSSWQVCNGLLEGMRNDKSSHFADELHDLMVEAYLLI